MSETEHQLIFESVGEGICVLDRQGRTTLVNRAASRMLGYTAWELQGRHLHEIVHPTRSDGASYPWQECPVCATLQQGTFQWITGEEFRRKDGSSFPIEYVSRPIRKGERISSAVIVFRDITERRRAEEERERLLAAERSARAQLEISEARFRALVESAPDAIVVVNDSGRMALVNAQMERLFGYRQDELLGQPVELLVPERLRRKHVGHRLRYMAEPRTRPMAAGVEMYGRRKDGSDFPVECSLSAVNADERQQVIAIIRDVTDRKQAEQALRNGEQRLQRLYARSEEGLAREQALRAQAEQLATERAVTLGQLVEGVVLADASGQITFANEAAIRHYGVQSIGTSIGNVSDLATLQSAEGQRCLAVELPLARILASGETVVAQELCIQGPDSQDIHVLANAAPLSLEDGTRLGAVMTLHDVSAQRAAERQKDEFLGDVSHDLRTPLTAIMTSIGVVLANEPEDMPAPLHRMLVTIEQAADRLAELVDNLLELTRLQAGRLELQPDHLDLRAAVEHCAEAIAPLAQARGHSLEVTLPPEPVPAIVDAHRLERAVLNVLGNANKYGQGTIRLSLTSEIGQATVAVSNDGPGIPQADQQRIFERYYRSAVHSGQAGSGLGLAIARAMVELHGGSIWVESEPGAGSTFFIRLPTESRPANGLGTPDLELPRL